MSKLPTMYVPVVKSTNGSVQMLSTKRIKEITGILPTKEEVIAHLALERKLTRETKGYKPVPYELVVTKDTYESIIFSLQRKMSKYNTKSISLRASSRSATIIKIIQENE